MPRTGRPQKAEEDRHTERIVFMATPDESESYSSAADHSGMKVSAWLRQAANREAARISRKAAK